MGRLPLSTVGAPLWHRALATHTARLCPGPWQPSEGWPSSDQEAPAGWRGRLQHAAAGEVAAAPHHAPPPQAGPCSPGHSPRGQRRGVAEGAVPGPGGAKRTSDARAANALPAPSPLCSGWPTTLPLLRMGSLLPPLLGAQRSGNYWLLHIYLVLFYYSFLIF